MVSWDLLTRAGLGTWDPTRDGPRNTTENRRHKIRRRNGQERKRLGAALLWGREFTGVNAGMKITERQTGRSEKGRNYLGVSGPSDSSGRQQKSLSSEAPSK